MVWENKRKKKTETTKKSKGKGWLQIGTLRDPDQVLAFNDDSKEDARHPYIVLNKDIEIFFKGEKVELNQFQVVKLTDPFTKIEKLLEGGHIDEEQAEKDRAFVEEKGILLNLTFIPDKKEE